MTFDLNEIEGRIAYAIYVACFSKEGLNTFCAKNGFTEAQFNDFIQHGVDAMTAFRLMDKYNTEHETEYMTIGE